MAEKEKLTPEEQIAVVEAVTDGMTRRYNLAIKQIHGEKRDDADRQTAKKYWLMNERFPVWVLTLGFNSRVNRLLEARYVERDQAEALEQVRSAPQQLNAGA